MISEKNHKIKEIPTENSMIAMFNHSQSTTSAYYGNKFEFEYVHKRVALKIQTTYICNMLDTGWRVGSDI